MYSFIKVDTRNNFFSLFILELDFCFYRLGVRAYILHMFKMKHNYKINIVVL